MQEVASLQLEQGTSPSHLIFFLRQESQALATRLLLTGRAILAVVVFIFALVILSPLELFILDELILTLLAGEMLPEVAWSAFGSMAGGELQQKERRLEEQQKKQKKLKLLEMLKLVKSSGKASAREKRAAAGPKCVPANKPNQYVYISRVHNNGRAL